MRTNFKYDTADYEVAWRVDSVFNVLIFQQRTEYVSLFLM